MELPLPISIGDRHSDETDYRDNLLVNYTMVSRDIKGDQGYIISHEGLTQFGEGFGIDRGSIFNDRQNNHIRISGERLITVDSSGVSTQIGLISGSEHAILPYSFQTQGILSDNRFWLYDGTSLTEVVDPDLGSPIDCVWINGIYFFTDGETLFHTRADDESAIDPLTFATSEFSPDRTYALMVNKQNQVVVFNRYSTEWFRDGGDNGDTTNFRFRRVNGKSVKIGVVATNCKAEMDGQIFVLGGRKEESPSVHLLNSADELTIATREIDKVIAQYTESQLQSVVMEVRVQDRDKFLIIRLPNETLLYNHAIFKQFGSKYAWTIVKTGLGDAPWRARNGVFDPRVSKWIYGDSEDSRLGFLDSTTNMQYDVQQENICYTPIVKLETFSINQIEMETVTGYHSGQINVFASTSRDGVTYNQEYLIVENKPLQYGLRFISRSLGYIRDEFNFKFRVVSEGRTNFTQLMIDYD